MALAQFQSTLPTRGSDQHRHAILRRAEKFQSTLPTRGSDRQPCPWRTQSSISIHAPHEGERRAVLRYLRSKDISIHAPHEGERPFTISFLPAVCAAFQSTLPTRGSDIVVIVSPSSAADFNPRSPRGGATRLRMARGRIEAISIHAPHEGERQARVALRMPAGDISIHAPHEGERRYIGGV